jgi:hypothetical protein
MRARAFGSSSAIGMITPMCRIAQGALAIAESQLRIPIGQCGNVRHRSILIVRRDPLVMGQKSPV